MPFADRVYNSKGVLRFTNIDYLRRQKPNCNTMFKGNTFGGCRYPLIDIVCGSAFAVLHTGKEITNA